MSPSHAAGDGSFGRSASGAAARGAILLAIAVALGVILLHAFDRGSGAFNASVRTTPSANSQPSVTFLPPGASTTQPLRAPASVKVLPVNGTATVGAGTKTGDRLKAAGYNVLAATNTTKPATTSSVQFAPGFEREARVVAQLLGLADSAVQPIATPPPVPDLLGTNLLVIVGPDLAGRGAAPAPTATTVRRSTATTAAPKPATTAKPAATTTTVKH